MAEGASGITHVHGVVRFGHWEVVLGGNMQLPLTSAWTSVLVSSPLLKPQHLG